MFAFTEAAQNHWETIRDLYISIGPPYFLGAKVRMHPGDIIRPPNMPPLYVVREVTEHTVMESILPRLDLDAWEVSDDGDFPYYYEVTTD